ncbi:hypothetical protein [Gordonia humi]|uniref:hypothetical protein n=1 Tax=Gordonia humi TaxID=686429 RepID=UPI0031EA9B4D
MFDESVFDETGLDVSVDGGPDTASSDPHAPSSSPAAHTSAATTAGRLAITR